MTTAPRRTRPVDWHRWQRRVIALLALVVLAAGVVSDVVDGSFWLRHAFLAEHADEVLGRWAGVMLGSEVYSEVTDRHVEPGGDVAWIVGIFDATYRPSDMRRQRRFRSSPAVEIESGLGAEWLADRIVVITQLAEELDRRTSELALRIVPVRWWEERLGTNVTTTRAGRPRGTAQQRSRP